MMPIVAQRTARALLWLAAVMCIGCGGGAGANDASLDAPRADGSTRDASPGDVSDTTSQDSFDVTTDRGLDVLADLGADAASDVAEASTDPCNGMMGLVCGARIGMDPNTLYRCSHPMSDAGTVVAVEQMCAGTCIQYSDMMGDACPCPAGDGTYCGARVDAEAHTLYQCMAGRLTEVHRCDICGAGTGNNDACSPCQYGDGLYCGQALGLDSNKLYQCSNGVVSLVANCAAQCQQNPPGVNDQCAACPSGDGLYCGGPIGYNADVLYSCSNGQITVQQMCPDMCVSAPAGVNDYCRGTCAGSATCSAPEWWNTALTYGPYQIGVLGETWWDTDLAISAGTPVQLRHDSQLVRDPVEPWGWMPEFVDMTTGQRFQFLHLHPNAQYTTQVGMVYCAGTIVGLSGGNTSDTGYPTYSTGAHLCVETIAQYRTAFPAGVDPCH